MEHETPHGWHGNTTDEKREALVYPWYRHAIRGNHRSKISSFDQKAASDGSGGRLFLICGISELQQLIDHLASGEDIHFGAGLRVETGQLGDRRSDHQRRNR